MDVEDFYADLRRGTEESDRTASKLADVRACNNFAKAAIFARFIPQQLPVRVYDWACGKGGDFFKLTRLFPTSFEAYTGVDITRKSIDDFYARTNGGRKLPDGLDFQLDAQDLRTFRPVVKKLCSVVTCQFAFHYFCESFDSMYTTLQKMSDVLVTGGRVLLTVPDPRQIHARLRPIGTDGRTEVRIINPATLELKCRVVCVPGQSAYLFELIDGTSFAVRAPEYFVQQDLLERAARDCGLKIVYQRNLHSFIDESRVPHESLAQSFRIPKVLQADDREILELYQLIVLEKSPVIQMAPQLSFF